LQQKHPDAAHLQRLAALSGNVWQESGLGQGQPGGVAQALGRARLGAQVKGPAAVAVGPSSKAGDEI